MDNIKFISAGKQVDLSGARGWYPVSSSVRRGHINAYVYRCIYLRAGSAASVPLVYESNDLGCGITPQTVFSVDASLLVYGAAYLLKPAARRGWFVLNPSTMRVVADAGGIRAFEQSTGGSVRRYKRDDVVYIRLWSPFDDLMPGLSPLEVARTSSDVIDNAEAFTRAFFEQGALPPLVVRPSQSAITDADKSALEAAFRRVVSGVGNAWRALVLRSDIDVKTLDMPALSNLAMEEVHSVARAKIAAAFGVPQTLLEDAANYATAREHRTSFWRETVIPDLKLITDALNDQHYNAIGMPVRAKTEVVEAIQQDEATKAQAVINLYNAGIITRDEARTMMDLDARDIAGEIVEELKHWRTKSARRGLLAEFRSAVIPRELANAIKKLYDAGVDAFSFLRFYKAERLDDVFEREASSVQREIEKVFELWLGKLSEQIAKGESADVGGVELDLLRVLRSVLRQVAIDSAIAQSADSSVLDIDEILNLTDAWAQNYSYELVKNITATTAQRIAAAVSEFSRTPGMTVGDVVDKLAPVFGKARAQVITVTEITRAYSQGVAISQQALEKHGIKSVLVWRTSKDEATCEICAPRDGKRRGDGWEELPPAHPNCRCWVNMEIMHD